MSLFLFLDHMFYSEGKEGGDICRVGKTGQGLEKTLEEKEVQKKEWRWVERLNKVDRTNQPWVAHDCPARNRKLN